MICTLNPILFSDQSEKNEYLAHVARMVKSRGVYRVWCGNLREETTLKTQM